MTTRHSASPSRRAFTLVEMIAVIIIVSVIGAVATGVIYGAAGAYASASDQREAHERVGLAVDTIVRALRDAPSEVGAPGRPDIVRAEAGAIELGDGTTIELVGGSLFLTTAGQAASPLCRDVEAFELEYIGADGVMRTDADPGATSRINIRLRAKGAELQTAVFLRTAMGGS